MKKYGKQNFERKILEYANSRQELLEAEQRYTDLYGLPNPDIGYNLKRGGRKGSSGATHTAEWKQKHSGSGNGRYHKPVSKETRKKISEAKKGNGKGIKNPKKGRPGVKKPPGFGDKISAARLGKSLSEEAKAKIRNQNLGKMIVTDGAQEFVVRLGESIPEGCYRGRSNSVICKLKNAKHPGLKGEKNGVYGKHQSQEVKNHISDKAKKRLSIYNPHNIRVVCIETGEIYESIKEANIKNNLKSIGACISGRTQTAGKLHWEVYDENKIYQTSQI